MKIDEKILIPAHAGVIRVRGEFSIADFAYPRACGGDPVQVGEMSYTKTLSPRMRG